MPHVAPGLIAVATGPIAYTATDDDGTPVAETVLFAKGDIIHDEALVKTLHDKHFHHALTVTPHSEHLCPLDCEKAPRKDTTLTSDATQAVAPTVTLASASTSATLASVSTSASFASVSSAATLASPSVAGTTGVN